MPAKNQDLHGSVPDKSSLALLMIDVVNQFDFDGSDELLAHARQMAERLAVLKSRAKEVAIPVIYVNDNFGKWRSDVRSLLAHALGPECKGREVVKQLEPDDDDYFVIKPKHSGFYSTTLDLLLDYLQVRTVILTGIATNSCVLFTANDAYMRDMHIIVPADCVAAVDAEISRHAIEQMRTVLKADTSPSTELDLRSLARSAAEIGRPGRRQRRQPTPAF